MSTDAGSLSDGAGARSSASDYTALLRKAMDFEHAFVQAGGLLIAGPDPIGAGIGRDSIGHNAMSNGRRRYVREADDWQ